MQATPGQGKSLVYFLSTIVLSDWTGSTHTEGWKFPSENSLGVREFQRFDSLFFQYAPFSKTIKGQINEHEKRTMGGAGRNRMFQL